MWINGGQLQSPHLNFDWIITRFLILNVFAIILFLHPVSFAEDNGGASRSSSLEAQGQCNSEQNSSNYTHTNLSAQCLIIARKVAGTQSLKDNDLIPPWANLTLFEVGQKFATRNIGYLGVSHFFALIFENFIPDIKDVLITTGSSSTRERAVKRYTATATQILLWYRNSLTNSKERTVLLESLRNVRRLHLDGAFKAQIRLKNGKYMESKRKEILQQIRYQNPPSVVFDERFWTALEKDILSSNVPKDRRKFPDWSNSTGTPISQFAQSLTQFSFAGIPVLFHRELGMSHVSLAELEGYIHMWAVLGHALGIKDEYNICMKSDFRESIKHFQNILNTYFIPAMFQIDWRVRVQLGSYLDALQQMDQVITPRLIMYRFMRDIPKIRLANIFQQLTAIERMYIALVDSLMSNNLDANRFLINQGGMFFLDVNGYHHFGSHYSSDERKSRGAFYTRENLVI
ncbi:unnamed protein product [Orchesella dallaii]|uniref:ER-bound oxygenase mpaB/mpaB'/Rubber oxygenase catalytic domain-containing protein n=1 Tax=Orchesella dallaii TaxID=48710 RepID=A0ABP1RVV2_9HEXA